MPLSLEDKNDILQYNFGVDPKEYDLDARTLKPVKRPTLQPNVDPAAITSPLSKQQQNVTSTAGAFGANVAAGIVPTAAGLATAAAGMAAIPTPATWAGAAAAGLGALALGAVGSHYAGEAQKKVLESVAPDAQKYLDTAQQEHPVASALGGVTSALPVGMRPDLKTFKEFGGALSKMPIVGPRQGVALLPTEQNALMNIGLGTGFGAGLTAHDIVSTGRDAQASDLISLLGGAVLNNPSKGIAGRLMHSNESVRAAQEAANPEFFADLARTQDEKIPFGGIMERKKTPEQTIAEAPLVERPVKDEPTLALPKDELAVERAHTALLAKQSSDAVLEAQLMAERKAQIEHEMLLAEAKKEQAKIAEEAQASVEAMRAQGIPQPDRSVISKKGIQQPEFRMTPAEPPAAGMEVVPNTTGEGAGYIAPLAAVTEGRASEIPYDKLIKRFPAKQPEAAPIVRPGLDVERPLPKYDEQADRIKIQQEKIKHKILANEPLTEAEQIQQDYDTGRRHQDVSKLDDVTEVAARLNGTYGRGNWGVNPSWDRLMSGLAKARNVVMRNKPTPGSNIETIEGQKVANIGSNANLDTVPHEVAHSVLDTMAESKSKTDREFVQRLHDAAAQSPEYKKWLASLSADRLAKIPAEYRAGDVVAPGTVHEFVAENAGIDYLRTERALSGETSWQQTKNDFIAHAKSRLLGSGDLSHMRRYFANRLRYDAPYEGGVAQVSNIAKDNANEPIKMEQTRAQDDSKLNEYNPPEYDRTKSLKENAQIAADYEAAYAKNNPSKVVEPGKDIFTAADDQDMRRYRNREQPESQLDFYTQGNKERISDEDLYKKYPRLQLDRFPKKAWPSKILQEKFGINQQQVWQNKQDPNFDWNNYRPKDAPLTIRTPEGKAEYIKDDSGNTLYRDRNNIAMPDIKENSPEMESVKKAIQSLVSRKDRGQRLIANDSTYAADLQQRVLARMQKEGIHNDTNEFMPNKIFNTAWRYADAAMVADAKALDAQPKTTSRDITDEAHNVPVDEVVPHYDPTVAAPLAKGEKPVKKKEYAKPANSEMSNQTAGDLLDRLELAGHMDNPELEPIISLLQNMDSNAKVPMAAITHIESAIADSAKREQPESRLTKAAVEEDKRLFVTQTEKELRNDRPFNLQTDKMGNMNTADIKSVVKKLPPIEQDLLEKAGLNDYLHDRGNKVNKDDLRQWIKDNGPQLEVHNYGMEGKVSEAKREDDRMTHEWYEQLDGGSEAAVNKAMLAMREGNHAKVERELSVLSGDNYAKGKRYVQLRRDTLNEPRDTSPRATSAYHTVSALPTNEPMPEWTTSKEGKNVQRVDVVIPQELSNRLPSYEEWKRESRTVATGEAARNEYENWLVDAKGKKVQYPVKWQPDNLHENLPNTLGWAMIQYKTGAKGEKIAVIAEAQSRWGQERRELAQTIKDYDGSARAELQPNSETYKVTYKKGDNSDMQFYWDAKSPQEAIRMGRESLNKKVTDHPLLRDYNRLILKAAIEQARKEGATHIMVSDGESALITEQLDSAIKQAHDDVAYANKAIEDNKSKDPVGYSDKTPEQWLTKLQKDYGEDGAKIELVNGKIVMHSGPREGGFRLNYDTILPKIAEELTGAKGERVSLGEHKNAMESKYNPNTWTTDENGTGLTKAQARSRVEAAEQAGVEAIMRETEPGVYEVKIKGKQENTPRPNLIFTNPDGTPKTDISGRLYPIADTSFANRRASGEQLTMAGKRYQDDSRLNEFQKKQTQTPEFKQWFGDSKIVDKNGEPLIVYHGSPKGDFSSFDTTRRGYTYGQGAYFTPEKSRAQEYQAKGQGRSYYAYKDSVPLKGSALYETYLSIKNPYIVSSDAAVMDIGHRLQNKNKPEFERLAKIIADKNNYSGTEAVGTAEIGNQWLRDQGYDGIIKQWNENEPLEIVAFYPEQIKSAVSNTGEFNPSNPDIRYQDDSRLTALQDDPKTPVIFSTGIPLIRSTLDNLVKEHGTIGAYAADHLRTAAEDRSALYGKFGNPIIEAVQSLLTNPLDRLKGFNDSTNRVLNYLNAQRELDSTPGHIMLTSKEREVVDTIRKALIATHEEQRKDGPLVASVSADGKTTYREPITNKNYFPHVMAPDVINTMMREQSSAKAAELRKQFRDYREKLGQQPEDIERSLEVFQPNKSGAAQVPDYNAVRREEGYGLPPEWREKDLGNVVRRYMQRWSSDMAFYRNVQNDAAMRKLLDIKDDGRGGIGKDVLTDKLPTGENIKDVNLNSSPDVQTIMRDWNHSHPVSDLNTSAITRVIKSAMMMTPTGISDVITAIPVAMKDVRPSEAHLIPKAIMQLSKGIRTGLENGTIKHGLTSLQDTVGMDVGLNTVMDAVATGMNKLSGREYLETVARGLTNSLGSLVAESRLSGAKSGNKQDIEWFNKIGVKDWAKRDTQDVITQAAARFTDSAQGTYDYRNLPRGVIEGPMAPVLSLAKWNIEQLNHFNKSVIDPLRSGDVKPLLMATLGAVIGGAAVEEIRKAINKRQPTQLTNEEWLKTGDDTMYKLAALASLSGFAGIGSEMVKTAMDVKRGNSPMGFANPLTEVAGNLVTRVGQLQQALDGGTKLEDAIVPFVGKLLTDHIQMARVANRHLIETEQETQAANAARDKRIVSQVVEGKDLPMGEVQLNPMMRPNERKFKKTESVEEAAQLLPKLIDEAIANSGGDYEKLKSALERIKSNSNSAFESPEEKPLAFSRQLSWFEKTKGKEKAQEALGNFLRQREINRAKSSMVPSI